MAKPIKGLELHYPMIQFLIIYSIVPCIIDHIVSNLLVSFISIELYSIVSYGILSYSISSFVSVC